MRKARCPAETMIFRSETIPATEHATGVAFHFQLAERATGYYWGEPKLRTFVEEFLAAAERDGDDRLEQVARRFLR